MKEVFNYGAEKARSKDASRKSSRQRDLPTPSSSSNIHISNGKMSPEEKQEIQDSVLKLKKVIMKQKQKLASPTKISIPLSYIQPQYIKKFVISLINSQKTPNINLPSPHINKSMLKNLPTLSTKHNKNRYLFLITSIRILSNLSSLA